MSSSDYIVGFFSFLDLDGDTPGLNSLYGAVAGAVSKILVYPLDTGKKLFQVYRLSPEPISLGHFLLNHFRSTGIRGLYAGVVAATLKSALSSSLLFGCYALSKKEILSRK